MINTSRGTIVNEKDLIESIKSNTLIAENTIKVMNNERPRHIVKELQYNGCCYLASSLQAISPTVIFTS